MPILLSYPKQKWHNEFKIKTSFNYILLTFTA